MSRVLSNHRLCEYVLLVSLLLLAAYPFADPDGWWHLRTGQLILETGSIPDADPFSGTAAGAPWIAHEWLTEILMYLVYQVGGFPLLTVTFSVIAALAFWIAYRQSGGQPFVAALATILGAASAFLVFGVRPQVISLLFVSAFLALLDPHETRTASSRRVWWLVPLMLVWVNLHAAFAIGLALIVLRMGGLLLDRWVLGDLGKPIRPEIGRLGAVFGACLLVVPLNPSGFRLYGYPFETMFRQAESQFIQEWQSPNFHLPMFQLFAGVALLSIILLGLSDKRPRPSAVLLLFATFYASLQAGRHIPIFALVAIPILAEHLTHLVRKSSTFGRLLEPTRAPSRGQVWLNGSLLVLIAIVCLSQISTRIQAQPQTEAAIYPQAAVEFLSQNSVEGTIFNTYEWGGYLIWNLYPAARPYIDGRPEIYGDPYVQEFMAVYESGVDWQTVLDAAGVRTALVQPDTAIGNILAEQPDWEKQFEDQVAVVFTRQ